MRKCAVALIVIGLAACGGDDDSDGSDPAPAEEPAAVPVDNGGDSAGSDGGGGDDNGGAAGGSVVNPQPAGQAFVSVDGLEFTMQEPGALDCTLADDAITFSFRIGDNEVTLGAGANRYDTGWIGDIRVTVANPDTEAGPIGYFPDLVANGDRLVVDGTSTSYSGPMMKQPANDGSNPPPVDVGDGIISITCP